MFAGKKFNDVTVVDVMRQKLFEKILGINEGIQRARGSSVERYAQRVECKVG